MSKCQGFNCDIFQLEVIMRKNNIHRLSIILFIIKITTFIIALNRCIAWLVFFCDFIWFMIFDKMMYTNKSHDNRSFMILYMYTLHVVFLSKKKLRLLCSPSYEKYQSHRRLHVFFCEIDILFKMDLSAKFYYSL